MISKFKNMYYLIDKMFKKKCFKSCAPKFDVRIPRTTGEQIIRVKYYMPNWTVMTFESSQQTTSFRVPKSDGLVRRPTGKDIVGSKCH